MALILRCDICDKEEEQDRNGNTTLYLTMIDGSQITSSGITGTIVDLCATCTKTTRTNYKDSLRAQILNEITSRPKKLFGGRNVVKGDNSTFDEDS